MRDWYDYEEYRNDRDDGIYRCDRCGEEFEPSDEMEACGPYMEDWRWRRLVDSEVQCQMDSEGWWSGREGVLCPDCVEDLEEKGVYPEDWEHEDEIVEELNGTDST